jgi:hypothetical protein
VTARLATHENHLGLISPHEASQEDGVLCGNTAKKLSKGNHAHDHAMPHTVYACNMCTKYGTCGASLVYSFTYIVGRRSRVLLM